VRKVASLLGHPVYCQTAITMKKSNKPAEKYNRTDTCRASRSKLSEWPTRMALLGNSCCIRCCTSSMRVCTCFSILRVMPLYLVKQRFTVGLDVVFYSNASFCYNDYFFITYSSLFSHQYVAGFQSIISFHINKQFLICKQWSVKIDCYSQNEQKQMFSDS